MSSSLMIAVAQPFCVPGDVEGNVARMEPMVRRAADAGVRLALFSEGGVTGIETSSRTLRRAVTLGDAACRRLHEMAHMYGVVIAAGFLETREGRHHTTHAAFFPDGALIVQRKATSSDIEKAIPNFTHGPEERNFFEVDGVSCVLSICAENGFPGWQERMARAGVQLLLAPTAGCGPRSLGFSERELENPARFEEYLGKVESVVFSREAVRLARKHRIAFAACNQMADDGSTYFHCGHSTIMDSTGELVALIPGTFVFEHLRPRVAWGEIHPARRGPAEQTRDHERPAVL